MLAHDHWLGPLHLLTFADRAAFAAGAPHEPAPFALRVGEHTTTGDRVRYDAGEARWQRPTSTADDDALVDFRAADDGTVYALADAEGTAVLLSLAADDRSPRWTRRITLAGNRPALPVDFVASREAIVLALDGGRQLAWLEPHAGTLVLGVDVEVR